MLSTSIGLHIVQIPWQFKSLILMLRCKQSLDDLQSISARMKTDRSPQHLLIDCSGHLVDSHSYSRDDCCLLTLGCIFRCKVFAGLVLRPYCSTKFFHRGTNFRNNERSEPFVATIWHQSNSEVIRPFWVPFRVAGISETAKIY